MTGSANHRNERPQANGYQVLFTVRLFLFVKTSHDVVRKCFLISKVGSFARQYLLRDRRLAFAVRTVIYMNHPLAAFLLFAPRDENFYRSYASVVFSNRQVSRSSVPLDNFFLNCLCFTKRIASMVARNRHQRGGLRAVRGNKQRQLHLQD